MIELLIILILVVQPILTVLLAYVMYARGYFTGRIDEVEGKEPADWLVKPPGVRRKDG